MTDQTDSFQPIPLPGLIRLIRSFPTIPRPPFNLCQRVFAGDSENCMTLMSAQGLPCNQASLALALLLKDNRVNLKASSAGKKPHQTCSLAMRLLKFARQFLSPMERQSTLSRL